MPSLAKSLRLTATLALMLALTSCHRNRFPTYTDDYREFAYVTSGAANTVTVLDLVYLRQDRVLTVGRNPSGLATNPLRNEVYAVNTGSDSVSVINTDLNRIDATIGVHSKPYMIEVSPDGHRAYVPNTASNSISILDLDTRRELANIGAGEAPGTARVTADNRTLVVSNRLAGSVSLFTINADKKNPLTFRSAYSGCPGATDIVLAPNSVGYPDYGARAFIACSGGHQVMDLWIRATPQAARQKQDDSLASDHLLSLLDVGQTPYHLVLKPDATEVFSTNFDSDSISEISIYTNEVVGTYVIGARPASAVISPRDNSSLWISNFGSDSLSLYSIDDDRMVTGLHTGSHPDALAFSADTHLLLVAHSGSADIGVFRTDSATPSLVTLLPSGPHPNDIVVKQFSAKDKK